MTTSVFAEAIDRETLGGESFFDWLDMVSHSFFRKLRDNANAPQCSIGDSKRIVMYILRGYSCESASVVSNMDWEDNKKKIAHAVGLSLSLYDDVIYLQNPIVCEVINDYLDVQVNRDFKTLQNKKDLHAAMQRRLLAESSSASFKDIRANSADCDKMLADIMQMERDFKERNKDIYAGKDDLLKGKNKSDNPGGNIEESKFIK